jgi:putative ABC transport system permease protein
MTLSSELRESARIAVAAIRANKLRSGLTTLGVVIGILTATLVGTMINGMAKRSPGRFPPWVPTCSSSAASLG